MSRRGGLKIVNDNDIYQLNRKHGDKTSWKCEVRQCKARLHISILDNDNISLKVLQ